MLRKVLKFNIILMKYISLNVYNFKKIHLLKNFLCPMSQFYLGGGGVVPVGDVEYGGGLELLPDGLLEDCA